jgi:hypothetical protein
LRSERHLQRTLGAWGSIRRWENATRERLRRQNPLWLHGWCIGLVVVLAMWATAHLQMVMGSASLALRYAVTLGVGYLVFLALLRWWAGRLVGERDGLEGDLADIDLPNLTGSGSKPSISCGGGGDFGGGGAEGSYDGMADAASSAGDLAKGALEVAADADDAAVVVIPVVAVFLGALLVLLGVGSLLLLFFGWEVLLTVAVEVAFGYVSARTAWRLAREGWLSAAVRITWKPLLGALACAVLLGALVDHFAPQAQSLPRALKLVRAK